VPSSLQDAAAADADADAVTAADPGTSSEGDFELQQQPSKRPRSSQRTGGLLGSCVEQGCKWCARA
jgi:hypothetical protein